MINKLKSGKSLGSDWIQAEMLKNGGEPICWVLFNTCSKVWGHVDSFQCKKKKKEKGDKTLCEPQKHELNKPLKKILQKFRKVNKVYTLAIMWIELNTVNGEALSLSVFLDSA